MYFSSTDAKKLKRGMKAQVAPLMVKTQEYGYIRGIVSHVNELPSTNTGIMSKLQNTALVNQLSAGAPPVEVNIALLPSSDTYSGYQWTSNKGPDVKIFNGTMSSAYVIVKEEAPISFIIPFFRGLIYGIEDETDINTAKANK